MQKEAEERLREMQSRARFLGESSPAFPIYPDRRNNIRPQENPIRSLLNDPDGDKLMILALLWILWNEKADPKLLLALLYLLL